MTILTRRRFITTSAAAGGVASMAGFMPAWARGGDMANARKGIDEVSGESIDLKIARSTFATGGRSGSAIMVNGTIPGPLIRLKEGQNVRLNVTNMLDEDSSIHWHGILLPFQFDGVPGVSFPGIKPGETFTAPFKVRQNGTYWWHSHSGLQEQSGHYGPIVIDPAGPDPVAFDREYVVLVSDFSPMMPHTIMKKLKQADGYFDYQKTTATGGRKLSGEERRMWGRMRMSPTDILDVTGSTYTYLINGHGPADNLELLFEPGERVRLRFINGSAMTFFNIRIPGLAMEVVQADGQNVSPMEVDEFQIGVAETYDVVVTPRSNSAFTLVAESMDRSGMGVAMLTPRAGLRAIVPPLRDPPILTMADMGMDMGGGAMGGMADGDAAGGDMAGMDHSAAKDSSMEGMDMGGSDMAGMDMGGGGMGGMAMGAMNMRDTSLLPTDVKVSPGLDMVSMNRPDRMGDPGIGLDKVDHRVLNYKRLKSLAPNKGQRVPTRTMQIHLTGNMERYMWSFDGKKFSAVSDDPIRFAYNERVRVTLVNDSMMAHPIHLHGHFFELVNGQDSVDQPRKHTVIVQPGGTATFDLTADEPGDWAFHCHLLYHMHAGMFQIVTVASPTEAGA